MHSTKDSDFDMKATGCHFPSSVETCERTAPVAKSNLSALIRNGFVDILFEGDFELTSFEFTFGVFNEGREETGATRVYLLSLSLLHVSFHLPFSLTSNATTWQASGHLNGASMKINLGVVLFEPAEPKNHALFP